MTSTAPLSLRTKLGYSIGNFGLLAVAATASFFLLIFLTDVAGIAPAIAGAALTLAKLWNAISDPLMGWLSDRTQSRHGRRRVYMIWGALPLGISTAILWMIPSGLSASMAFTWILIVYVLFETAYSMVQIPYAALAADLTTHYDDRTKLVAFGSIGALVGYVVGSVGAPIVIRAAHNPRAGYLVLGIALGVLVVGAVAQACINVHEGSATSPKRQGTPIWTSMVSVLRNRPFVLLASAVAVVRIGLTMVQTVLAYFVLHVLLGDLALLSQFMATLLAGVALSIPFWRYASAHWDKKFAYAAGIALTASALGVSWWLGPHEWLAAFILFLGAGVGMGAQWVVPHAMLPDSIDLGQVTTSERRSGMYVAVYGLVDKVARIIGIGLVAVILDNYGYVNAASISPHVLEGVRVGFGLAPALLLLAALPIILAYPITRRRQQEIQAQISGAREPA